MNSAALRRLGELQAALLEAAEHRLADPGNEDGSGLHLFWAVYDIRHFDPAEFGVEPTTTTDRS